MAPEVRTVRASEFPDFVACVSAGFLQSAAQAEDTFAVGLFAQSCFARAQHDEFGTLEIELADLICGEDAIFDARDGRAASLDTVRAREE